MKFDHFENDTVPLKNPGGTFVNTGGSNEIDAVLCEIIGLFVLPNNITLRSSGFLGKADRDINLLINGASAPKVSDTVDASGFGFGVGVPVNAFGLNTPGLCVNGGVDFMDYGSANGLTPGGAPIHLGSIEETNFRMGLRFRLNTPDLGIVYEDGYESGNVSVWSRSCP